MIVLTKSIYVKEEEEILVKKLMGLQSIKSLQSFGVRNYCTTPNWSPERKTG